MPSRLTIKSAAGTVPFRTANDADGNAVSAHVITTEVSGVATPVAEGNPLSVKDTVAETSLTALAAGTGTADDAAWSGTGASTIIAALKAIYARVSAPAAATGDQPALANDGGALSHVTNFPAIQPVSAASLPLPAGAATAASQPALNGDGGALAHVTNLPATQAISAASLPLPSGAAQDGTDATGVTPPTGATGIRGWLSGIYSKLSGTLTTNVTGSVAVTGTFWPGTQPVSLTSLPLPTGAAQDGTDATGVAPPTGAAGARGWLSGIYSKLSGTLTTNVTGSVAVTGTFWQATQPVSGTVTANVGTGTMAVSAAALPLPAGAATAARQAAPGTAGAASADVLTVQGTASMTALRVDGSGVTQPVSLTALPALPTGNAVIGQVAQSGTWTVTVNGTTAISAAALPLPAGAATAANQIAPGTAGTPSAQVVSVQGVTNGTALSVSGNAGGFSVAATANFTRPANTTAYASGQLVANNTTAASVVPLTLTTARTNGGTGQILRAGLAKSGTSLTNASFRVHLYSAAPATISNGDGTAWLTSGTTSYLGALDVTMTQAFTDGAKGIGTPNAGGQIVYQAAAGTRTLFALVEARAAYTPASGEVFTLVLEGLQD